MISERGGKRKKIPAEGEKKNDLRKEKKVRENTIF
jgi:hypothetical protein